MKGTEAGEFLGFEHPDASFIMCPNEFLDLLLPNASRGCVRLVGYVLYQTFRWIDETGQPNTQEIEIPFSDLIRKAGISRGAAKPALKEAINRKYIKLVRAGAANSKGESGSRTIVALNWSSHSTIAKSLDEFDGFFQGRGNFTTVPHSFFEYLLRKEKLAVLRFVGFVFRNTVGYQTQFGRRKVVPLSFEFVQKYAGILSSDTLNQAIKHSIASNYVERVEQGVFEPGKQKSRASVFAPKFAPIRVNGSKTEAGISSETSEPSVQKSKRQASSFRNENGSKIEAGEQFKNRSEIKNQKKETQQTNDDELKVRLLVAAGFEQASATNLARTTDREVIERQIRWMKYRNCTNYLGFLRKAISDDFDEPIELAERRKRRQRDDTAKRKEKIQDELQSQQLNKLKVYKAELRQKWFALNPEQREELKRDAISRCPTAVQNYLRKRPTDGPPALEFVNELAIRSALPTTMQYESEIEKRLEIERAP